MLTNFLRTLFPPTCLRCGQSLERNNMGICYPCLDSLPKWPEKHSPDSFARELFGGRVPIDQLQVLYAFRHRGSVQQVLHHIKYGGGQSLAVEAGKLLAERWKPSIGTDTRITPVPIHPEKLRKRGYNQSHMIARGIASSLDLPLCDILIRTHQNTSQTFLSRRERWENIRGSFATKRNIPVEGTYLLVDDTLTTGATMEACAEALLDSGASRVSATAIAYAQ